MPCWIRSNNISYVVNLAVHPSVTSDKPDSLGLENNLIFLDQNSSQVGTAFVFRSSCLCCSVGKSEMGGKIP